MAKLANCALFGSMARSLPTKCPERSGQRVDQDQDQDSQSSYSVYADPFRASQTTLTLLFLTRFFLLYIPQLIL